MKRLVVSFVLIVLASACGEGATALGPAPGGSLSASSTASPTDSPDPSPSSPATTVTYEVWFLKDGRLHMVERTEPSVSTVGTRSIELLLEPALTAEDRAEGIRTGIPDGTSLRDLSIDEGVATIDLSRAFTEEATPATAVERLAQVVYTLTQFASIRRVRFEVEGEPLSVLGGYQLDRPQSRDDLAFVLPAIIVTDPEPGDRVSSPVPIAGTADVFEATVSILILDADGDVLASTFTNATCGTGCRGTFSTQVSFDVATEQRGTIRVYEVSAKDGSQINVVNIPVTLTP
jgi:hypothetical protein